MRTLWVVAVLGTTAGVLIALALAASGSTVVEALGLPDPGALVLAGLPLVRVLADLSASATVGALLVASVLVPPQRSGYLDLVGYRATRTAGTCAAFWAVAALAMVPLTVAEALGRPLPDVLSAGLIIGVLPVLPTSGAWLVASGFALVVAVGCRVTLAWGETVALLILAVAGLVPVAATGHSAVGGSHDIATDSLLLHVVAAATWVGGLLAVLVLAARDRQALSTALPRFSTLAGWCWGVMAVSGVVNLAVRLPLTPAALVTTYGAVVVAKSAALVLLGVFGHLHRRRTMAPAVAGRPGALLRWGALEVVVMTVTVGLAVGLGRTPPPPVPEAPLTRTGEALGYDLAPPTGLAVLLSGRLDLVLALLVVVAGVVYATGVRRLRRSGERWLLSRTAAWTTGLLAVLVATSSGVGRYGAAMFGVHIVGQVVLLSVAPVLLAAGAPLQLARRALPARGSTGAPSPRGSLLWVARRPLARRLRRPGAAVAVLAVVQAALHAAGWLGWALESQVGRMLLDLVLLLAGCVVVGALTGRVLPAPRHAIALVAVQSAVGLSLLLRPDVVGGEHFRALGLAWVPDLLAEQRVAAVVWLVAQLPVAALLTWWVRTRPAGSTPLPTRAAVPA